MIRRLFWALLGLGFGLVLGMRVLRQVDRLTEAAKPGAVAERTGRKVGSTTSRLRSALEAGQEHARQRELELRQRYGVPTLIDIAKLERDSAASTDTNTDAPEA